MSYRFVSLVNLILGGALFVTAACSSAPAAPTKASAPSAPTAAPTPTYGMASPDYAVQVFLWGSPDLERDLRLAKDAGFTWIKQMFQWDYIEKSGKGKFEWNEPDRIAKAARDQGLKILARIDMTPKWARDPSSDLKLNGPALNNQDFADFVGALAERYKSGSPYGEIAAFQIWNEPNLAFEWGGKQPDPVAYTKMLQAASDAAKRANPQAVIISAGLSPTTARGAIALPDVEFLKGMYAAGAGKYFDLLGAHGAGYKAPPEIAPEAIAADDRYNHGEGAAGRIYGFRHVEDIRKIMVENGDSAKRLAVLEFGWTSDPRPDSPYKWHSVSEQEKADYIVRAFRFAKEQWQPWIAVMSLIYIADPNWSEKNEQYHWSVTAPDGTPRPAYTAVQKLLKQ